MPGGVIGKRYHSIIPRTGLKDKEKGKVIVAGKTLKNIILFGYDFYL